MAYGAAFLASSSLGYLLNNYFTFRRKSADSSGAVRYLAVNAMLLLLNGGALRILVEYFHMWYLSATLLLAAINTPVSYIAHRLLSYRVHLKQATPACGN